MFSTLLLAMVTELALFHCPFVQLSTPLITFVPASVPPTSCRFGEVITPLSVNAPPCSQTLPAPLMRELLLKVPPLFNTSVPLCASTVPVLVNATPGCRVVAPLPADLRKVPALL